MHTEYKRKSIHILNGMWVFALPFFSRPIAIILVLIAFLYVFFMARPNSIFGSFFSSSFEAMARKEDHEKGFLVGPTIYVVMVLLVVIFLDFRIAGSVFAMLAFGDGLATVIGITYGKHKIFKNKTGEGFLAFVLSSFIASSSIFMLINYFNTPDAELTLIGFLILPHILNIAVTTFIIIFFITSLLVASVELFLGDIINDNYLIPISGSLLLYLFIWVALKF